MSTETQKHPDILSMQNITKIYGNGFMANKNICFSIRKGEIHGLVGENGAGKSTLMKVLFGQEIADEGKILLNGEEVKISNPLVALDYGIGMVHQHFMLVPSMTVAENMVLGDEPRKGKFFFDYKTAIAKTREISQKYNLSVNPEKKVRDLSVGYKQRVEILRILLRGARVLLLDEPTAVLTPQETRELFAQLKKLKNDGFTVVFISHKLGEIKEICDRITVLRDGQVVGTCDVADVTEQDISRMMVGRDIVSNLNKKKASQSSGQQPILQVRNLGYTNKYGRKMLKNVSFDVRPGEIVAVAGVEGNGQSDLAQVITGLAEIQEGEVLINSKDTSRMTIREMRQEQVSFISEDRMTYDLVTDLSIQENLISDRYYKPNYHNRLGLLRQADIAAEAVSHISDYLVACDGKDAMMKTLSGGNMQKVITARECTSAPRLLIASQPTRGIDVGATEFIRKKMVSMRDEGTAVLLFSSDLSEVLEISDSILVFYGGQIVGYFPDSSQVDENLLGEYMLGLCKQTEEEIGGAVFAN